MLFTFYLSDTQDLLHKSSVMDVSLDVLMKKARCLMSTFPEPHLQYLSLEAEELKVIEALLCKSFDTLVTESNSMAATYHKLVQEHATCERAIKELTASGNSNIISNQIQLLQNEKAHFEQSMVQAEDAQCLVWKVSQELHSCRK